jgi:glycosyltransferase involved in cell wall biosynthesis
MELSIVIPAFNEEGNIHRLIDELTQALDPMQINYEVIFIDDGSTDKTSQVITECCNKNSKIKLINFRRNFGQTAALAAGIDHASGEVITLLDADLQNDPVDIRKFYEEVSRGADVVVGWRKKRKDKFFTKKLPSMIANFLFRKIGGVNVHDLGCTLKAFKSNLIQDIQLYGEMHRFIPLYVSSIGGEIKEFVVNHRPRYAGTTKYSMFKIVNVILDFITTKFLITYTTKPMHFFGKMGILTFILSVITFCLMMWHKLKMDISIVESPLLILFAILFILSTNFILLGLISEMLMRTYYESQQKPSYKVKDKYNFS